MVELRLVTESDRADWEALARAHFAHFDTEMPDEHYGPTWQKLVDGEVRGLAALVDGTMVGIAHYVFHAGVWRSNRCYLADLFVAPAYRRRGIATAMIRWMAKDAEENGAPRLYWNTLADAPARKLYDKLATVNEGLVVYTYRAESLTASAS